jgi:hypothetical protein
MLYLAILCALKPRLHQGAFFLCVGRCLTGKNVVTADTDFEARTHATLAA